MYYFDQHIHCDCSFDSPTPMRTMALAARERGMNMVLFTDHVDMCNEKTGEVEPHWPACRDKMVRTYRDITADPPEGIEIRFGIELGELNHCPDIARECVTDNLDFVLGSLHNLRATPDFYYLEYTSEQECAELNRRYLAELYEMTEYDFFDVMAHVGYTCRYMHRQGFKASITLAEHGDELGAIFRRLIEQGRGIEVNTSGIRQLGVPYPTPEILSYYRELGGEILSVGSDGHVAEDAGRDIHTACELLRSLGFRYITAFRHRKPEFIAL